jgi:uncharacterized protein YcfL
MKKLLALVLSAFVFAACATEPQKVCIDKIGKDGKVVVDKAGKPQQECKMMKIHKKLEVEETKKK